MKGTDPFLCPTCSFIERWTKIELNITKFQTPLSNVIEDIADALTFHQNSIIRSYFVQKFTKL